MVPHVTANGQGGQPGECRRHVCAGTDLFSCMRLFGAYFNHVMVPTENENVLSIL